MAKLESKDFGLKLYNKFPSKYREDDALQNFTLKRYFESLADGGFKYAIDEINGILNLIDPETVDSKILPILFKQYGLEVFNGIPEDYLRYLLPQLGEMWSNKGSISVVEYITSSISGIKTTTGVNYDDDENPIIDVKLEMDYNIGGYVPEASQLKRLLEKFIPFYSDTNIIYSYFFHESSVLTAKDMPFEDFIHDVKAESKSFSIKETTDNMVSMTYVHDSTGVHEELKESFTNVNYLNDGLYTNGLYCWDIITTATKNETSLFIPSIGVTEVIQGSNAVLGNAVLGNFILGAK